MAQTAPQPAAWNPWHAGERTMQMQLGVAEQMTRAGAVVIRDHMPDEHRAFFSALPFVVFASVDHDGDCWASIASGRPGFIGSSAKDRLEIALKFDANDPAHSGLGTGSAIGLLGIELAQRRRNRMNGTVLESSAERLTIGVDHSFGNCPQYIQQRDWHFARDPAQISIPTPEEVAPNAPAILALIEAADTFFVASYADLDGARQVDVSHRGGRPGFVRMDEEGVLTIPDFAGNLHFNTLGNFLLNPRAGLLFPDFETGDILQLIGDAHIITDSPEIAAFEGAERLWTFRVKRAVLRKAAMPIRFDFKAEGWSPNALMTGDWQQADARLKAGRRAAEWRAFRIAKITQESRAIGSFYLEPEGGLGLIPHKAGQHLPIRLSLPDEPSPIIRTYTLSSAPSDPVYRISVKREDKGKASRFLHDHLEEGDIIHARAPAGDFTIDASVKRPAVLIGGGVGITPMVAMLRHLVHEKKRSRTMRQTWLFHAGKNRSERAFDQEIAQLAQRAGGDVQVVNLVSEPAGQSEGDALDDSYIGRLSVDLLRASLPLDDYDFYLCGPAGLVQNAYDALASLGVADDRVHAEAFGPSSLTRIITRAAGKDAPTPAKSPVKVSFSASRKEASWEPDSGSLLDLAEARGLAPSHSCRTGSCGSCAAKLISGKIAYSHAPSAEIPEGHVLICSAVPAANEGEDNAPLVLDV